MKRRAAFSKAPAAWCWTIVARVAYACRSPRTDERWRAEWAREMGYDLEMFAASDETGTPIYHTNVLMHVGTRVAVVALDAIERAGPRAHRRAPRQLGTRRSSPSTMPK